MAETKSKISADLLEKARKELNEDQSKVHDQIQSLREEILENPNLNFRIDDAFLLKFLRARKFDQERALDLMTNYYKQRVTYPDLFRKSISDLEKIMNTHCVYSLQDRDAEGRAIVIIHAERWIPSEVDYDELVYGILTLLEYLSEDETVQINGCVFVVDYAGLSLAHVSCLTPWKLKRNVSVILNCFPMRFKGFHYVNESPLFDGVFALMKPFLSEKIKDRILFHGNCYASLHEYINPEILPEELGGDIDPFDYDVLIDSVMKHFQVMDENISKYGFVNTDQLEIEKDQEP